jgi:hypothetical protein
MAELTDIYNSLFFKRASYKDIPIEDKEKNFFIINRLLSKEYPLQANLLNNKIVDKGLSLDIWFLFLKDKKTPRNFWNKSKKLKEELPKKESDFLKDNYHLTTDDISFLNKYYPKQIKELLKDFNI